MAPEESTDEHDQTVEIDGIRFVYNSGLSPYMEGLNINYKSSWLGKGFEINRNDRSGNC
ncbi:hypothetical protein skT53_32730 [Effusibacillus dendaii]|uniref:Uncharacterized protein n=1 Tax=Effusibacillus dendaii TaxID=2743772 RepID=A0A7I8DDL7_9BACL|nr:hypothetical protein skT53_32730 [Effusibacillus dendaii]